MTRIFNLIEDYKEFINNLLLGGIEYNHSIDNDFCERIIKESNKVSMDFGAHLIKQIMDIYEKERMGLTITLEEKSKKLFSLITYIDQAEKGVEEEMTMAHLDKNE